MNLVLIAYASSEGSGEPAHPRSLARTFAARSYKQWVKRNLQTESQIPSPSEWLRMRSLSLSWRNARRHKFAWRGSFLSLDVVLRSDLCGTSWAPWMVYYSTRWEMSPVKRICVFEHSVMINFNCACPAIQRASTVLGVTQITTGIRQMSPGIKCPSFTGFWATSCHWGPMYLVVSKSSEFDVNVSAGIIFTFCNIKIVCLHRIVWRQASQALSDIPQSNTRVLLHGGKTPSLDTNIHIFSSVQKYIESTKRL